MTSDNAAEETSRRGFLSRLCQTAGGVAAFLAGCSADEREAFFQDHFKELEGDELQAVLERLQREAREDYGVDFEITAEGPIPETLFGYGLDLSRCIGCRTCVYKCAEENNLSRNPQVHYITVLEMDEDRGVNLEHADAYFEAELVPRDGYFYMPVACQQCENSPCSKVCPVGATWMEPDGIVVVDYNWCIGCRYCQAACPYGARKFNWARPSFPEEDVAAGKVAKKTHYLGNRPRPVGVVEKCTWCIHRVRKGRYPRCVEVCPVGARKFGNLLDPASEIRYVIATKRVFILKEELHTQPKFFYFYGV